MTQQQRMRMLAYDWHGGGGSPLYSSPPPGGVVHTEEHREGLVAEVQANIDWCEANQSTDEAGDRVSLRDPARLRAGRPTEDQAGRVPQPLTPSPLVGPGPAPPSGDITDREATR